MADAPVPHPPHAEAEIKLLRDLLDYAYEGTGLKRWHITRFSMYRTLGDRLAAFDGPGHRCLCISGSPASPGRSASAKRRWRASSIPRSP